MRRFIIFSVALFTFILIIGSIAFIFSMRQIISINKGNELSQMLEIERNKLEYSVASEIAIALQMADSPLIKRYFENPGNPELEKMAFEEIASYRRAFTAHTVFWVNDKDKLFYFNDDEPYIIEPAAPENYWYPMTLYETELYNFNINYNPDLMVTNLWINAPVFDGGGKPLGMVGTGIDLQAFLNMIYEDYIGGADLYFIDAAGEITGAKDITLVAEKKRIADEFGDTGATIIINAKALNPGETKAFDSPLGKVALSTIPLLEWYSVAIMPGSISEYNNTMTALFLVMLAVTAVIFIVFNVFIAGLLKPLRKAMADTEATYHATEMMTHWYKSILDATPFPITVTDANMHWTFVNKAVEDFLGVKREDIMGKPCSNWNANICNTDDCGIACAKRGLKRTYFSHDDNSYQVDVEILKNLNGETAGFIEVVQDITTMIKTQEELVAASEAKSAFLANMSHELRTPLNVIIGLTDLMAEEPGLPDPVRENLTTVSNAGGTLLSIVNDILDISKIESGKMELVPVEYYIPSLLNDVTILLTTYIGEKPIKYKLNIDGNLPNKLYGDELRVKQILTNLLSNAVKYTHDGTVELNVVCERYGDTVWMDISVKDTGIGMKEENLANLFTNYYQADAKTNRKTEGTGLGLSITRRMVEMMGGTISVESEYGKGSIFRARLRQGFVDNVVIGNDVAEKLSSFHFGDTKRQTANKIVRADLSHATVLVVDDMQNNLDVAAGLMRKYKMKVDCLTSGRAAIDRVLEGEPVYNAIFMDHMMPELDGVETVKEIRALDMEYAQNVPIIALTANAVSGTEKMFLENGFQDFLSKPIDIMLLDNMLKKWVRDRMPEQPAQTDTPFSEQEPFSEENDITIDIPGVNAKNGIAQYGGDIDIYLSVLRSYAANTRASLDQLHNVTAETLPDCVITSHGIKGTSANICAEHVREVAAELEATARNGDLTRFLTLKAPFLIDAEHLVDNINAWFAAYDEKNEKPRQNAPDPEVLKKLRQSCEAYDMSGIDDAMDELERFSYDTDADLVAWLREKTDIMELDEVIARLSDV